MENALAQRECVPCKGGIPPLQGADLDALRAKLDGGWQVVESRRLVKEFEFKGYKGAVDFTNRVAQIAEEQDHHPDILLSWGRVTVTLWTHKVGGLTENDFILAAKAEDAYPCPAPP